MALKFYKGGFANRRPEVIVLGGIATGFFLLALDIRSAVGGLLIAGLWLAGVWFNLFRRKWALVELTNEGLWLHRRFNGELHQWSAIQDVVIGQDNQGRQQILVHVADNIVALPRQLRVGRTDLSVSDVHREIVQFHERFGRPTAHEW